MISFFKKLIKEFQEADYNAKMYNEVIYLRKKTSLLQEQVDSLSLLLAVKTREIEQNDNLTKMMEFFKSGAYLSPSSALPAGQQEDELLPMVHPFESPTLPVCEACNKLPIRVFLADSNKGFCDDCYASYKNNESVNIEMCVECFEKPATKVIQDDFGDKVVCDRCYDEIKNEWKL